jgi:hypothetical protein
MGVAFVIAAVVQAAEHRCRRATRHRSCPFYSLHSSDSLTGMVHASGTAQRLVVDTTLNVRTESVIPRCRYDNLLPFSLSNICQIDPIVPGGPGQIGLIGALSAMLRPGNGGKPVGDHDLFESSVKVVAGAGNHRQLTGMMVAC